ncbi:NAD(P)-dependent oxidoreductase [Agrococcus sp. ProA11]|uniref:NAD(P)-dependent oxidoreductase n=1 Tax=Agrococcus chionoecetis TaxID=3153752 RepID=UPI0032614E52
MSTEAAAAGSRVVAVCRDLDELDIEAGVRMLEAAGCTVLRLSADDPDTIAREAADAEALLLGYARVDADLLARLPRLGLIANASMGVDMVDVDAATARGVWVANVLGAATEEVATHALALALAASRRLIPYVDSVRSGGWDLEAAPMPRRASEQTLGLLGLGRIGLALAERASATFGRVVGYDPYAGETPGVERMSADEVLAAADVLSLHLPLMPETAGYLNAHRIALLPPGATVVNVSRGGLIDEPALLDALERGHLAAAALDVLATEPPAADDALVAHPRVLVTPHAAFRSDASMADYVRLQAENVLAWLRTDRPVSPVNAPLPNSQRKTADAHPATA